MCKHQCAGLQKWRGGGVPTCPSVSLAQMGLPPSTHVVCSEGPGVPLGELHMGCGWSACIQLGGISDHPCPSQHALLCHRGHPAHHHVCLMSFRTGRGRLELSGVRAPGPGCPAGAASPGPTLPSSPAPPHTTAVEGFPRCPLQQCARAKLTLRSRGARGGPVWPDGAGLAGPLPC